jgi:transposase
MISQEMKDAVLIEGMGWRNFQKRFKTTYSMAQSTVRAIQREGIKSGKYAKTSDIVTQDEKKIFNEIKKAKLTPIESKRVLRELVSSNKACTLQKYKLDIPDRKIRIGSMTDLHIGHKKYRPDILEYAAKIFRAEKVDFITNSGDTLEGMSGRKGHIYELKYLGFQAQRKYFISEFEQFTGMRVISIEATDSHTGWFNNIGNQGVDAGEIMANESEPYEFIGYDEQDIVLDSGLIIRLYHTGGGTAYALSYHAQNYINDISGGKKPHILIQGHYHKAFYMFYRNVHHFDAGCMQEQTSYMLKKNKSKKGNSAMLGFWIIDIKFNKTNWSCEVGQKFYPFYE